MALSNLTKVQTVGIGSNIEVVGVVTTGEFKSGTSNLHSTGIELTNLNVSGIATIGGNLSVGGVLTYEDVTNIDSIGIITARSGINVSGGQLDVGSNIKIGNAGVITATSFVGSGAGLTGITQTTINTNADNRIITGSGTANTLNGESGLTFNGTDLIMNTSGGRIFCTRTTGEAGILLGSGNAGGATLYLDGDSNGDWSGSDYAYIRHNTGGDLEIVVDNPANAGNIKFFTNSSVERVRINSNGRVNIGDTYNANNDLDYCRLSIYGQTTQNGTNKNLNLLNLYNYGSGNVGDITGIGLGAAASPDYTKASLAFIRTSGYGRGDLIFCINNEGNANMVTESDERLRITSGGVIQTGSKTITGGNNLAIQGYAVKGIWSGSPSIGKEIELISGYDSSVKMAAIGYNLTDVNTGSTYGGDLVFHTQPLYSSPTTPLPERMRISSTGYVTKSVVPCWNLRPRYNSTQTTANTSSHHAIGWGANGTANSNFLQNCTLEASGFTYNIHNGQNYGKLKVPVAGRYYVNVTYRVENNPNQGNIYVYVNNSQIARQHVEMWGHRPYMHCQYASVLNLAKDDTILISVSCPNANISGYNDNVNWFSGYLIG